MRYYDTVEEVRRRLEGGVILYRGEPVYVVGGATARESKAKYAVNIRNLPGQDKSWRVALDDPDLNFRQIRLGFVNTQDGLVLRAMRYPQRGVQQSCTDNNTMLEVLGTRERLRRRGREGMWETFLGLLRADQTAVDSLAGRYPSMTEARQSVEREEVKAKAFHPDWCYQMVMGVPALWYKQQSVGITLDPRSVFRLPSKLLFLKEPLQEIGIKVSQDSQ